MLQIANGLRCPASKFITHTVSHICFLLLLTAATFRLDGKTHSIDQLPELLDNRTAGVVYEGARLAEEVEFALRGTFRPANTLITNVQIGLMFWIIGQ